jgi:SpoVK/Ycf46/Vps4 family AAA+-type ATPase
MDEIEKGLASGGEDGGVSRRVLGYLLTWMAERKAPVFIVATANQVHELPAELLRKGRFDEIFFVDLPSPDVRVELLRLHLGRSQLKATTSRCRRWRPRPMVSPAPRSSRRSWPGCMRRTPRAGRWTPSC